MMPAEADLDGSDTDVAVIVIVVGQAPAGTLDGAV